MEDERVAITELADDLQVRKQRIFKILPRLGISPMQRRDVARRNQMVATVTVAEAKEIRNAIDSASTARDRPADGRLGGHLTDDAGYFYFIQLEPEHDRGRFKVGFTVDLDGRLQKHRSSAPFSVYLKYWTCLRAWERTAIDCVTVGCEKLHTEVFRSATIDDSVARADKFFSLMPGVSLGDDEPVESEIAVVERLPSSGDSLERR